MPSLRPKFSVLSPLLFLVLTAVPLRAQNHTVSGQVFSETDSTALGGVAVQIKGTHTGVLTNRMGNYSINLRSASDTLVFTFLGYASRAVPVDGQSVLVDGVPFLSIALTPASLALERIIIQGYPAPPGMLGTVDCSHTFSPMPGSAYDPNWQGANPELARLMFPRCNPVATPSRPTPQAPPAD
jgi:hypothetical protein